MRAIMEGSLTVVTGSVRSGLIIAVQRLSLDRRDFPALHGLEPLFQTLIRRHLVRAPCEQVLSINDARKLVAYQVQKLGPSLWQRAHECLHQEAQIVEHIVTNKDGLSCLDAYFAFQQIAAKIVDVLNMLAHNKLRINLVGKLFARNRVPDVPKTRLAGDSLPTPCLDARVETFILAVVPVDNLHCIAAAFAQRAVFVELCLDELVDEALLQAVKAAFVGVLDCEGASSFLSECLGVDPCLDLGAHGLVELLCFLRTVSDTDIAFS